MKRKGNAANPARFLRPLHFAVEKHVAYRTENGALYGLLTGKNRFLSPCDFKELRVIKRARFTTSTLAASQRSLNSIARTDRRESKKLNSCKLKLSRSADQDNHRISDCADFLGGADGVVLHLRAGML